jgi:hypothetical protein
LVHRGSVTEGCDERHNNTHGHESHAAQQRHSAFVVSIAPHAKKLAQGDSQISPHQAEYDDPHARANPRENSPLVWHDLPLCQDSAAAMESSAIEFTGSGSLPLLGEV